MTPVRTAARTLLAGIFVAGGATALLDPEPRAKASEPVITRVAPMLAKVHEKVPTDPRTLVQVNGAVQVIGGVLLPTRLHPGAALALIRSIIPTTIGGPPVWGHRHPGPRAPQPAPLPTKPRPPPAPGPARAGT